MRNKIENYCTSCHTNKAVRKINRATMQVISTSTSPFERLSLDIIGPLQESCIAKVKYILTLQDDSTKYLIASPIRSTTVKEISAY